MENINELFSSEEIEALKTSGTVGAKSVKTGAKANKPKALKIVNGDMNVSGGWASEPAPRLSPTPMRRVTRPNVPGSGEFVRQTNLSRFNAQDEARKKKFAEEELAREEARQAQSPESLQSQVQYLTRAVKKLQKELNSLKALNTNNTKDDN